MSADNWTRCPKCEKTAAESAAAKKLAAEQAYGKVPAERYMDMLADANEKPTSRETTFREDYEQGVVNGEYIVSYHGQCRVCGFKHQFNHRQQLSW
jgi:hypothetical protein